MRGEHVTHQGIASSYTYVHTGSQALPRKQGHFSSQSLRAFRAHSYPTLPTTSFLKQAHARSAPPKSPVGMSTVSSRRSAMTPRRPKAAMALLELSAETPRRMIRCPRYVLSSGCGVSLCVCACARACACACACVCVHAQSIVAYSSYHHLCTHYIQQQKQQQHCCLSLQLYHT